MYLFNDKEIKVISARRRIKEIKTEKRVGYLKEHTLLIEKGGIADWGMYYRCPVDSAPLVFDFNSPHKHICSECGIAVTGKKYDGAWWGRIHNANSETAYKSALAYVADNNEEDFELVRQILLSYADIYPSYPEHGDIPYNDKGKVFAQTLDEAVFLRELSYAYDIISDKLREEEKYRITENLFQTGAEFLASHCGNQIHNHEVLIRSQIGVLGIILEDEEFIYKGVYDKYGLMYQLEHGLLSDGFWFEGSISYHQYALSAFMAYEIFARHTKYSNLSNPKYLQMAKKQLDFINTDGTIPSINDHTGINKKIFPSLSLEFAYAVYGDEELLSLLSAGCENNGGRIYESLFFGTEFDMCGVLPTAKPYHNEEGSGITIFRGENNSHLIFKHSPFGGEHDHYDRLSVEYCAYENVRCQDLGTVSYGAVHHYGYFKNTAAHNTVTVNGKNQPPAASRVMAYYATDKESYVSAETDFTVPVKMPDSHIIKQWDNESYSGIVMKRQILWYNKYWLDIFTVDNPKEKIIDWGFHADGELFDEAEYEPAELGLNEPPYSYFKNVIRYKKDISHCSSFKCGDEKLRIFSYCDGMEMFAADVPGNPPSSCVKKLIIRSRSKKAVFVNVFDAYKDNRNINTVDFSVTENNVSISVNDIIHKFDI